MKSYPSDSIFVRAVENYGIRSRMEQTVEECCELTVAICHKLRNDRAETDQESTDAILSELADVQIMLHQMIYIFGLDEFEKKYSEKIDGLKKKIKMLE